MIYGYCRVSTPRQSAARQRRNIESEYPNARIFTDYYTGTSMDRPSWTRMRKQLRPGDTVVFDEINRMSRNAEEGMATYSELCQSGVELVFLQQHHLDTAVYKKAAARIPLTDSPVDSIIKGLNEYLGYLLDEQIQQAFNQAQDEVEQLHRRTSEGMETARREGKQIGRKAGTTYETEKGRKCKAKIRAYSAEFGGSLNDTDLMAMCQVSRNTYYRYKRAVKEETMDSPALK